MSRISRHTFLHRLSSLHIDDLVFLPAIGKFPDVGKHPYAAKRDMAHLEEYQSSDFEPFAIIPSVPMTGVGYIVKEGGFTEMVVKTFSLDRLHSIRQLGFLQRPTPLQGGSEITTIPINFSQSRYVHVLDVQTILVLMLHNNGISGSDLYTARAAALLHDTLTPAGGDTTKLIDREAFDEDLHFPELLANREWGELRRKFHIDPSLLIDTVQGNSHLSGFLDIADKIAYTCRDYMNLVGIPIGAPQKKDSMFYPLSQLTSKHHTICGLWDTVHVMNGRIVFTNPRHLENFLKLRALMFRNLYYDAVSRFTEFVVGRVIMQHLYQKGILTRETLLSMTDWELESIMSQFLDGHRFGSHHLGRYTSHVECYPDMTQGRRREEELHKQNLKFTLLEEVSCRTKSGVHYLVKGPGGVLSFSESFPKAARKIDSYMKLDLPVRLYWLENADISPNLLNALASYIDEKK